MASKSERERQKHIQDKCQAILGQLLREEDNKYCVDCDAKGPRWASWNLGMFLCIRCAGIHRNLGVHISRVKSVNLDTWTPEQVACLQQMGNSKGRAVYEANLPDNFRRPQTDSSLEAFIRSKYEQKKYIAKEWVPPPMPPPAFDIEHERRREKDKKRPKPRGTTGDIAAPTGNKVVLPRPQSTATPAACASQNTADLLGLEMDSSGSGPVPEEDPFDEFLSAAPVATAVSAPCLEKKKNLIGHTAERRCVLTKESILSLYGTPQPPTFPAAAAAGVPMQAAVYGVAPGGGFATTNVFLQGVASMPGGSMRLPQQQPHLAASSSDNFEGQPFHSNPFLSPVAQPANIPQLQQQMASLQLGSSSAWGGHPAAVGSWSSNPAHQGHTLSTNLWH
ncbi:stromal membrane-associated protein 1 isoform X1 [Rhipicephalus microplus]|uniref:stromal membrane-associated protein 1 isoform X1 n=1 Tax=Rhipicephalus microplus TaxID=6941 RepID=UPI003F6ADEBA